GFRRVCEAVTTTALLLILASTVTHAGWNLLSKQERPSAAFMLVANTLGMVLLAPALVFYGSALRSFPLSVWLLVGVTGVCQSIYFSGLAGAYRWGDMSVAYPLARAVPVVLVAAVSLALGQRDQFTLQALAGMALVVAGSLLLPRQRFGVFRARDYVQLSTALALLAALGTAGYSLVDDHALRLLRESSSLKVGVVALTLLYALLEGVSTSLWLGCAVLARREERAALRRVLRQPLGRPWLAGLGIHLAYTLVLVAMAYVTNVSYVVAFRQLSIPVGAALGVAALGEPAHRPKLVGVALMFVGLVLVATG
ncbi:MAG: multidrug DMT transporter permease, partial [Anaerolineales bacterium]|nr:multidrug DMT transporter permease [Anaerolineales bacterium]